MFRFRYLLLPLLLAGCDVPTPLPLTPVQVIQGAWPPPAQPVAIAAQRNYTITGDTFAFPASGFSIKRPNADDWQFVTANGSVAIETRDTTSAVRPSLTIAFNALPAGTDVPTAIQADETNLKQKGATVANQASRTVSGVSGTDVTYTQTDPSSGLTVVSEYVYVPLNGVLVLMQIQATQDQYNALKSQFDQMIASAVLPVGQAQATGTAAASGTAGG